MKHVGTGAPIRQTLLVTGFGAFPGARRNPTLAVLVGLERHRARLARLGIDLRCTALPVVYAAVEPALRAAVSAAPPDAILHLGLAGRRRMVTVETRAVNRANPLHPDAARRYPAQRLSVGVPMRLRATYPAARLRIALVRAGLDARLSIDAGDYVCNATLFRSLAAGLAPRVGFIHVPKVRAGTRIRPGAGNGDRPRRSGGPTRRKERSFDVGWRETYRRPTIDDLVAGILAALPVLLTPRTKSPNRLATRAAEPPKQST